MRLPALLAALTFAASVPARASAPLELFPHRPDGPPAWVPRLQIDPVAIFDFLPRGTKGDADWEWPIVVSALVVSAGLAVGASAATTLLAPGSNFGPLGGQIFWGAMQFLALPPFVALATWGLQALSYDYDSNYYMPLLFSYAAELVLIGVRIAAVAINPLKLTGNDLLGNLKYVDWVLHFLLVPVIAEFITLHQREPKGGAPVVKIEPGGPPPAWTADARDPWAPAHGMPGAEVQTISFAF